MLRKRCAGPGTAPESAAATAPPRRVDRVILDITDRLIRLVARKVDASGAGEVHDRALDAGMFVVFPVLLFGFAAGAADAGGCWPERRPRTDRGRGGQQFTAEP